MCMSIYICIDKHPIIYKHTHIDTYTFLGVCICNIICIHKHRLNFIQRENAYQSLTLGKVFFSVFTRLVSGRMWSVIAEATA